MPMTYGRVRAATVADLLAYDALDESVRELTDVIIAHRIGVEAESARSDGYEAGHTEGRRDGFNAGRQDGYAKGLEVGRAEALKAAELPMGGA